MANKQTNKHTSQPKDRQLLDNSKCSQGCGATKGLLFCLVGVLIGSITLENCLTLSATAKYIHTYSQQFFPKLYKDKDRYNNVHNNFVHNSTKLKITLMSTYKEDG